MTLLSFESRTDSWTPPTSLRKALEMGVLSAVSHAALLFQVHSSLGCRGEGMSGDGGSDCEVASNPWDAGLLTLLLPAPFFLDRP